MAKDQKAGQSRGGETPRDGSGNRGGRRPSRGGRPRGQSSRDPVWGKLPKQENLDQAGLTNLFEEQKRLKGALRRQARLAKLDESEVRSTEAEHLRRINQQIAGGFSRPQTAEKLFNRKLTPAQKVSEAMLRRQGSKYISTPSVVVPRPVVNAPSLRRKVGDDTPVKPYVLTRTNFLSLCGPLVREFSRAKGRGYHGPPNRWLRGAAATKLIAKLRQKGMLHPLWTGKLSVFDRHCPLRYAGLACMATEITLSRGFHGERLYRHSGASPVTAGQAKAVTRLPLRKWPTDCSGSLAWPTFPTFIESWERCMRGKVPVGIGPHVILDEKTRKLPSSRVLPGMKARTISNHVIGIRASVPVPEKFLAYFQYRWGFLILKRNRPLPNGLASFLADRWKADISELFLRHPIRYNDALRRIPSGSYLALSGWVKGGEERPGPPGKARWTRTPRDLRRALTRRKRDTVKSPPSPVSSTESGRDAGGYGFH